MHLYFRIASVGASAAARYSCAHAHSLHGGSEPDMWKPGFCPRTGVRQSLGALPSFLVTPFLFMNIVVKLVSALFFYEIVAKRKCLIFLHFVFINIVAYTFILTSFFSAPLPIPRDPVTFAFSMI